jgi:hypothetical protein
VLGVHARSPMVTSTSRLGECAPYPTRMSSGSLGVPRGEWAGSAANRRRRRGAARRRDAR